jgi:hypothetical protein
MFRTVKVLTLSFLLTSCTARPGPTESDTGVKEASASTSGALPREKTIPSPPPPGTPWHTARPGLDHRYWAPLPGARADVFRIDTRTWELRVAQPPQPRTAKQLRASGAAVVVNGGFFDREGKTMGLRVSGGRELHPWREADWGVFSVGMDGRAALTHARDWTQGAPAPEFAIEAGPRLVVDGLPLGLKPSVARRTLLAVDASGRTLLVVTRDAVELSTLAKALAQPEHEGGLGAREALNLDGGPSTQLATDPALFAGRAQPIQGGWPVPDAIEVHPRPR